VRLLKLLQDLGGVGHLSPREDGLDHFLDVRGRVLAEQLHGKVGERDADHVRAGRNSSQRAHPEHDRLHDEPRRHVGLNALGHQAAHKLGRGELAHLAKVLKRALHEFVIGASHRVLGFANGLIIVPECKAQRVARVALGGALQGLGRSLSNVAVFDTRTRKGNGQRGRRDCVEQQMGGAYLKSGVDSGWS
jgi:hypothetical protein